jgi:putative transposase
MKRVARRLEEKVKNKVQDVHRKLAKFLCDNYDTVIIPPFAVKNMVKRRRNKRRKIGKVTSRKMMRWSHYAFRALLISKGEQTGTRILVEGEHWTTKTCSRCLHVNLEMTSEKVYDCKHCGLYLLRDINAARNILIKNWSVV